MNRSISVVIVMLYAVNINAQTGASAHSDAIHAFDDSHKGGGGLGFGALIVMIIIFIVALYIWGNSMNKGKK
ncbi:hypothetical protein [uncultured Winogradskyella sp.]|uniref:hypothetical protein n=1 Tax=uncultured Winogradskyella sp. TaxID=395353 RepID=UPI00261EF274|nr:hypothetical protein [uncultured Winogradskyella sp.]